MKIAENGVFCAEIILPETPTKREKFAAELLFDYAEKMCDRKLRYAPDAKNKIIIGNPERNAAAAELISAEDFKKSVPGPEGFMILSCENTLLLAGSSGDDMERERGTLYAVYELLERFSGAAWQHIREVIFLRVNILRIMMNFRFPTANTKNRLLMFPTAVQLFSTITGQGMQIIG